jgi:Tfp pilus assembly protein PilN
MIERINLIEKEPFTFTKQRLVQFCLLVVLVCSAFYGYQYGMAHYYQKQVTELQVSINKLKAENKALKKAAPPKIQAGSQSQLQEIFVKSPKWSDLLDDVVKILPENIWLKEISKKNTRSTTTASKGKNNAPVVQAAEPIIEIDGITSHPKSLTEYVNELTQSSLIRDVLINQIDQGEDDFFEFDLTCYLTAMPQ